ncbi:hypothetical protein PC39_05975 [Salinisphaera sp. PC39]|uniref:hypothetical protein n=1 Tax=Salinisphaera sp. PC39 TaxID=1304156 RepID=UPI003340142E
MSVRKALVDNPFLVAAVLLPLLVAAFFLAATAIPRWLVAPPAHDAVFTATRPVASPAGPGGLRVEYAVEDGRVVAHWHGTDGRTHPRDPTLYRYDHASGRAREVTITPPADPPGEGETRTVPVAALAGLHVDDDPQAPDGYRFRSGDNHYPGLFGVVFGMGGGRDGIVLAKNGRRVPLNPPNGHIRHYGVQFLGWVTDDGP